MRKIGMFLIGAISGGVVGTAVAILLAPSSGETLRVQISEYSRQLKDDVVSTAQERRAALEQELDNLRQPKTPAA